MNMLARRIEPDSIPRIAPSADAPDATPDAIDDIPLVVDLDGTLIDTNLLLESALALVKRQPWYLLLLPVWLWMGKAVLKREIARRSNVDVRLLPYNESLLNHLQAERAAGRRIVLATGADELLANDVARYLQIFDVVHASDGRTNLTGKDKRDRLTRHYGEAGFDYVGNDTCDIPVWERARVCLSAGIDPRLQRRIARRVQIGSFFGDPRTFVGPALRVIRPHQWLKNLLVFAPMAAAHQIADPFLLTLALLAFASFSLCASSAYVLNDLLDLTADRRHPRKRLRPFASGRLALHHGLWMAPALLVASFAIATALPVEFLFVLAGYFILTLVYSFYLKRVAMLDVVALSSLYGMRILGGAAAVGVAASISLLAFSLFIFLSLALLKRFTELDAARHADGRIVKLRSYEGEDRTLLVALGSASGYLSVLVFAQYIDSEVARQLYLNVGLLWLACPMILYWVSHIWLTAHRGQMHDDPVVFVATDRISQTVIALVFGLALLAR